MEHLSFDIFSPADLAYLRDAVMQALPTAPRPPTMGDADDIPWSWLRDMLATPPAEVAALLNVPARKPPKRPAPTHTRLSTAERYESYIGERYGLLTITGYGGTQGEGPNRKHLVEARCDCGEVWRGQRPALVAGYSKSCGCLTGRGRPRSTR